MESHAPQTQFGNHLFRISKKHKNTLVTTFRISHQQVLCLSFGDPLVKTWHHSATSGQKHYREPSVVHERSKSTFIEHAHVDGEWRTECIRFATNELCFTAPEDLQYGIRHS